MTLADLDRMDLWQLLEVGDTDPAHVAIAASVTTVTEATREAYGEGAEEWAIGDDVIFGSKEWFEQTDEIPF